MLLYITAEDVFGSDTPRRRGPQPLHEIPGTMAGLFDLGLRHHVREAAMLWWTNEGLEGQPDWKVDRLAIRVALCGRERLGLEPGGRVAVFGRLGWLWPVVDFASMGFGLLPLGLEHDLGDDALCAAVDEAAARVAFATDAESASRLLGLIRGGRLRRVTLVAAGVAEEDGVLPLERFLDLGSTLDTAERAQSFRAFSRQVSPESDALWHVAAGGARRLTHRQAMQGITEALRARPAQAGDIAYVEAPRVSLAVRCALARFVGDGLTTTALGREGRSPEDVAALRPHKALVRGPWLESAVGTAGPRWPAGLDRPWARRRIRGALGGRLRWIESEGGGIEAARRNLALARVTLHKDDGRAAQ